MMRLSASILAILIPAGSVMSPGTAVAWDNVFAHPKLAESALIRADVDGSIKDYLDILSLSEGRDTLLALQFGFDPEIDADLGPHGDQGSRLRDTLIPDEPDPTGEFPSEIEVDLNPAPPCPKDADFASCFAARARAPVLRWIMLGTYAEDNPNPRARHHFHDPEREHSPPAGNHGLDNTSGLLFAPERTLTEIATFALERRDRRSESFWGLVGALLPFHVPGTDPDPFNFALRGRSAVDRAFNTSRGDPPSERIPPNLFALPDAERYLYRGLTAANPDEREHYLALHFLALGHVLHFLQDMGSVGHVRNDFILEHAVMSKIEGVEIESAATLEGFEVGGKLLDLAESNGGQSRPRTFLLEHPAETFELADYQSSIGLPGPEAFEDRRLVEYFDEGAFDDPSGSGLAEFVNRHFFSNASVSDVYSRPLVPDCNDPADRRGSGDDAVWIADLPERDLTTEGRAGDGVDRFISSPLVPHLARCRAHCQIGGLADYSVPDILCGHVGGDSVVRDYIEVLWPFVLRYTSEFLDAYLAPRIAAIPAGGGGFRLLNRTSEPFEVPSEGVDIVYETADPTIEGRRVRVPTSCTPDAGGELVAEGAASSQEPGEPGPFTCAMPTELPAPPLDPGSFWVVARGALGSRGAVADRDVYEDGGAEFVTAFDRQQTSIALERRRNGNDDTQAVLDVLVAPLDPEDPAPAAASKPTRLSELLTEDPEIDFARPDVEPNGTRIVFKSDLGVSQRYLEDPSGNVIPDGVDFHVYLLDLARGPASLTRLTDDPRVMDTRLDPVWAKHGGVLFYWENLSGEDDGEPTLFRYDPDNGEKTMISYEAPEGCNERAAAVEAALDAHSLAMPFFCSHRDPDTDELVGASFDLFLMTVTSGHAVASSRIDMETGGLVSCEGACPPTTGFTDEGLADFSPDGTELAFTSMGEMGEGDARLFAVDLQSGPVRPVVGTYCVGGPTWSGDGTSIAFPAKPSCQNSESPGFQEIYQVSSLGGAVRKRRGVDPGFRVRSASWFQPLVLR